MQRINSEIINDQPLLQIYRAERTKHRTERSRKKSIEVHLRHITRVDAFPADLIPPRRGGHLSGLTFQILSRSNSKFPNVDLQEKFNFQISESSHGIWKFGGPWWRFQTSKNFRKFYSDNSFFSSPRRFERAILKRPNTVRCLAVKSTLLGTLHPRKKEEAAQLAAQVQPNNQRGVRRRHPRRSERRQHFRTVFIIILPRDAS